MTELKNWTVMLSPTNSDLSDREDYDLYQQCSDLSALLYPALTNITFDLDSNIVHLAVREILPKWAAQVCKLLGHKSDSVDAYAYSMQVDLMSCLADFIGQDMSLLVGLEYEDHHELRTFTGLEVDMDLSRLTEVDDLSVINLRHVLCGFETVPFIDELFLAVTYTESNLVSSKQRLPTHKIRNTYIDGMTYVEEMGNWSRKAMHENI